MGHVVIHWISKQLVINSNGTSTAESLMPPPSWGLADCHRWWAQCVACQPQGVRQLKEMQEMVKPTISLANINKLEAEDDDFQKVVAVSSFSFPMKTSGVRMKLPSSKHGQSMEPKWRGWSWPTPVVLRWTALLKWRRCSWLLCSWCGNFQESNRTGSKLENRALKRCLFSIDEYSRCFC